MFELTADCNGCDISSMEQHIAAAISVKNWPITVILSAKFLFKSRIAVAIVHPF